VCVQKAEASLTCGECSRAADEIDNEIDGESGKTDFEWKKELFGEINWRGNQ
jgi:hypothetical protein